MPLTTDEKLLTLSRDAIAAFDKIDGGIHPGFRPAHAKGILLTGVFTPSSEAAALTRAPHIQRNSTPVTVRFLTSREFRISAITTRRVRARAVVLSAFTLASMFIPTSWRIRSTPFRPVPAKNSSNF